MRPTHRTGTMVSGSYLPRACAVSCSQANATMPPVARSAAAAWRASDRSSGLRGAMAPVGQAAAHVQQPMQRSGSIASVAVSADLPFSAGFAPSGSRGSFADVRVVTVMHPDGQAFAHRLQVVLRLRTARHRRAST